MSGARDMYEGNPPPPHAPLVAQVDKFLYMWSNDLQTGTTPPRRLWNLSPSQGCFFLECQAPHAGSTGPRACPRLVTLTPLISDQTMRVWQRCPSGKVTAYQVRSWSKCGILTSALIKYFCLWPPRRRGSFYRYVFWGVNFKLPNTHLFFFFFFGYHSGFLFSAVFGVTVINGFDAPVVPAMTEPLRAVMTPDECPLPKL